MLKRNYSISHANEKKKRKTHTTSKTKLTKHLIGARYAIISPVHMISNVYYDDEEKKKFCTKQQNLSNFPFIYLSQKTSID